MSSDTTFPLRYYLAGRVCYIFHAFLSVPLSSAQSSRAGSGFPLQVRAPHIPPRTGFPLQSFTRRFCVGWWDGFMLGVRIMSPLRGWRGFLVRWEDWFTCWDCGAWWDRSTLRIMSPLGSCHPFGVWGFRCLVVGSVHLLGLRFMVGSFHP